MSKNNETKPFKQATVSSGKNIKLKGFWIETFTGNSYLNFATKAIDKQGALQNLLVNSNDLNNTKKDKKEWIIKIKQVY